MKTTLLIIILLLFIGAKPLADRGQWVIDTGSQLLIHGKTNINSYTCSILQYDHFDTLGYTLKSEEMTFVDNTMVIPVKNFDCGNKTITKDLRRTVRAFEQPNLYVTFISLKKDESTNHTTAKMKIRLAGIAKLITVEFLLNEKGKLLQLTGKKEISFTDFNLKAPRHAFGLIKAQPNIVVEFNLIIKPI